MAIPTAVNPQHQQQQGGTQSIAELITDFFVTTGDVPPVLIGATLTKVYENVFVFGGRIQATRRISDGLYMLNLPTRVWKLIIPQNEAPLARYFHSANWDGNSNIVYYGGMGGIPNHCNQEEPIALDDVIFFNTHTLSWEYTTAVNNEVLPTSRYAHVSLFAKDKLIIMGGQDVNNKYLTDICVFDCKKKIWYPTLSTRPHQYGSKYSAATVAQFASPFNSTSIDILSDSPTTAIDDSETNNLNLQVNGDPDINIHIYTSPNSTESPRQLHSWKMGNQLENVDMRNQSSSIGIGSVLPPPLRFPSAFMCAQQFILAGPHIAGKEHQFQIWALDTNSFIWTKIEVGDLLSHGSWLKGVLCESTNNFLVFGHPERSMFDDYKDRAQSYEYLAAVDIEIFGVYRPPLPSISPVAQRLGLSLLKDPALSDLKIVTTDQQTVTVNSALLAQRWPYINQYLSLLLSPKDEANKPMTESAEELEFDKRELNFPDTYVVLIAFLQYIYTDHLVTAEQHQPHILARLLFLADLFDIIRLKALAVHALHQMLNIQTAPAIYESASLSNAAALQVRALRVMINAKKMIQRQKQFEMQQQQQQHQQQQQQHQQQHQQHQYQHLQQQQNTEKLYTPPSQSPVSKLLQKSNQQRAFSAFPNNRSKDTNAPINSSNLSNNVNSGNSGNNGNGNNGNGNNGNGNNSGNSNSGSTISSSLFSSNSSTTSKNGRLLSQKSMLLSPAFAEPLPSPTLGAKTMKLPSFRFRQTSSPAPPSTLEVSSSNSHRSDTTTESSYAYNSSTSSPKVAPSSSSTISTSNNNTKSSSGSRTHTPFWKSQSSLGNSKKMAVENRP